VTTSKRFDHVAALQAARDFSGYTADERRVLYALIAFADDHGQATVSDEALALGAGIMAAIEADGGDPVEIIMGARDVLARGDRGRHGRR